MATENEATNLTKLDSKKRAMINALEMSYGIVKGAAAAVGISRQTHYDWMRDYPIYKQAVEDIDGSAIDHVEGKLFEKINGITMGKIDNEGELQVYDVPPSDTAIIFYLKTKGKKRGYVERTEIENLTELKSSEIKLPDGTIISIG